MSDIVDEILDRKLELNRVSAQLTDPVLVSLAGELDSVVDSLLKAETAP